MVCIFIPFSFVSFCRMWGSSLALNNIRNIFNLINKNTICVDDPAIRSHMKLFKTAFIKACEQKNYYPSPAWYQQYDNCVSNNKNGDFEPKQLFICLMNIVEPTVQKKVFDILDGAHGAIRDALEVLIVKTCAQAISISVDEFWHGISNSRLLITGAMDELTMTSSIPPVTKIPD